MKFNEETVKKLEEAFSIGADVSAACYYADISRGAYYQWCKENEGFEDKMNRLREKPVLRAFQTIAKNLDDTDTAKWYLERKRKSDFSTRVESELSSKDDKPIFIIKEGGERNNATPETVAGVQQQ